MSATIAPHTVAGPVSHRRAGGFAAVYLAVAYLVAMPYFLVVSDYLEANTAAEKVDSLTRHYAGQYVMTLITYVFFGIALTVLALALFDRLQVVDATVARLATAVGLVWASALILSGLVFTHGMSTVTSLATDDPRQAAQAWQAIEPISDALGGAGGELLGGVWMVLIGWLALRGHAWPRALAWYGLAVGVIGLGSLLPAVHVAVAAVFGLLQLVWFGALAVVLLRARQGAVAGEPLES